MIIIEELDISNFLSIKKTFLRFEKENFVTICNLPVFCKLKSNLISAIRFILSKDVTVIAMEGHSGYVRMKFKICMVGSSRVCVDAMRTSRDPNQIYYYLNGDQYIDSMKVYHERCQIDVSTIFPLLNEVFSNENNNLMSIWNTNKCPFRGDIEKSYELLSDYLDISDSRSESEQRFIFKLTGSFVLIDQELELSKKRTFVAVANEIGKIFNYITFGKYIVKFYIPTLSEPDVIVQEVEWEKVDYARVETYIQNTHLKNSVIWNKSEPGLKYLLKIAQLIALSKNLGQKFILIEDTSQLQDFQNQEMIREAILQESCINNESNWAKTNFLNQIVNICNEMKIMVFMNYHGALPLPPKNANIIRWHDSGEVDGQSIYVCQNSNSMTLEEFVRLFTEPVVGSQCVPNDE